VTLQSAKTVHLWTLDGSHNKQTTLPYSALSLALYSARFLFYVLLKRSEYLYIMQVIFIIQRINWTTDWSMLHMYLAQNSLFIFIIKSLLKLSKSLFTHFKTVTHWRRSRSLVVLRCVALWIYADVLIRFIFKMKTVGSPENSLTFSN